MSSHRQQLCWVGQKKWRTTVRSLRLFPLSNLEQFDQWTVFLFFSSSFSSSFTFLWTRRHIVQRTPAVVSHLRYSCTLCSVVLPHFHSLPAGRHWQKLFASVRWLDEHLFIPPSNFYLDLLMVIVKWLLVIDTQEGLGTTRYPTTGAGYIQTSITIIFVRALYDSEYPSLHPSFCIATSVMLWSRHNSDCGGLTTRKSIVGFCAE